MLPPPQLARLREHALGQTGGAAPLRMAAGTASPWPRKGKLRPVTRPAQAALDICTAPVIPGKVPDAARPACIQPGQASRIPAGFPPEHRCGRRIGAASPNIKKRPVHQDGSLLRLTDYLARASSTATAQATLAPTMGLLPMPLRPIISTCAGTEEEPANWASECMRPMVSVMP